MIDRRTRCPNCKAQRTVSRAPVGTPLIDQLRAIDFAADLERGLAERRAARAARSNASHRGVVAKRAPIMATMRALRVELGLSAA